MKIEKIYEEREFSGTLKGVLDLLRSANRYYQYHLEEMDKAHEKIQDTLHFIELQEGAGTEETAEELKVLLQKRREHKDMVELYKSFAALMREEKARMFVSNLQGVLENVHDIEELHKHRVYKTKQKGGVCKSKYIKNEKRVKTVKNNVFEEVKFEWRKNVKGKN